MRRYADLRTRLNWIIPVGVALLALFVRLAWLDRKSIWMAFGFLPLPLAEVFQPLGICTSLSFLYNKPGNSQLPGLDMASSIQMVR